LANDSMRADSRVQEVDLWVSVPLDFGKDIVVKSDVNTPTWKTVFTVAVVRGEARSALIRRIAAGRGVYWDPAWEHSALTPRGVREQPVKKSTRVP
ncbi:MAG: hypothetical protein ABR508_02620, partial [Candidatus Baltobacteraceae bacterium]